MRVAIGVALFTATLSLSVLAQPNRNLPSCVNRDCNCDDFSTWQEAQRVLDAYSGDPFELDRDSDGIACEYLSGGPLQNSTSPTTSRSPSRTTNAPTNAPGGNRANTNTSNSPNSDSPRNSAPIRALW